MRTIFKDRRGFTKQEALIIGGIVLVLVALNIFLFFFFKNKNHDIQVLSDVNQIRSGLALAYSINTFYPERSQVVPLNSATQGTERLCLRNFASNDEPCERVLMSYIPNTFFDEGNRYYYQAPNPEENYFLQFELLTNFNRFGLVEGPNCATRDGFTAGPCFSSEDTNNADNGEEEGDQQ